MAMRANLEMEHMQLDYEEARAVKKARVGQRERGGLAHRLVGAASSFVSVACNRGAAMGRLKCADAYRIACVVMLVLPLLVGCRSMAKVIGEVLSPRDEFNNSSERWPLEFHGHSFGAYAFSTYGCKVVYNGSVVKWDRDDELRKSSESVASYPNTLRASRIGYYNFPPPAIVTWRSQDGTPHRADVDIGVIFKDQLVRHRVPREHVAEYGNDFSPGIILEVNDRTINVYMSARIWLNRLRDPEKPHSNYQIDLTKVYSRTY